MLLQESGCQMSKIAKPIPNKDDYSVRATRPIYAGKHSSFWYGGNMATISYKGYQFHLEAIGDVRVVHIPSEGAEPQWYKDKNNDGLFYEWFNSVFNTDKELYEAINNVGTKKFPHLEVGNNNWYEVMIEDPNGKHYDYMWVLDNDNYFEAIEEIVANMDDYIQDIEAVKKILN
jgi:hypothetical protein